MTSLGGYSRDSLKRPVSLSRPLSKSRSKFRPNDEPWIQDISEDRASSTTPQPPQALMNEPKTLYFCTSCEESFQEKSEWNDHEYLLHERQYFWPCPSPGCDTVFTKDILFTQHHEDAHNCMNCQHAVDVQRPLPSKRSWACGFDLCKTVFDNWNDRSDHVASHFEDLASQDDTSSKPSQWKYSNMIRNLLRQPDVREAYSRYLVSCHGEDKQQWPRVEWLAENSGELRRRLEYRDFRLGVLDIAKLAHQLSFPTTQEAITILTTEPEDSPDQSSFGSCPSLSPGPNSAYLFPHIDKFPQPGTNPFDLYGPVPPSPIIQLDFITDMEPVVEINHSSKSSVSISQVPYSLYPSPTLVEKELPAVPSSKPPSIRSPDSGTLPDETAVLPFNATTSWATAYSTAGQNSPPRPKTPMAMIRQAKSLMRKKSNGHLPPTPSCDDIVEFDQLQAAKTIATYTASGR
jgi:hypothetical protein